MFENIVGNCNPASSCGALTHRMDPTAELFALERRVEQLEGEKQELIALCCKNDRLLQQRMNLSVNTAFEEMEQGMQHQENRIWHLKNKEP